MKPEELARGEKQESRSTWQSSGSSYLMRG
jgi:hypothetical protein